MSAYSEWPVEPVSPLIVLLDDENPRINAQGKDQSEIRELLLQAEQVTDLARSIASAGGLFPHDIIIVVEEAAGYRVLEGNRRIASLQLLLNRKLLPTKYEKSFPVADNELKKELSDIRVVVSPDRASADIIIAQIHAFSARKKWSAIANYRYAYRKMQKAGSISAIADTLGVKAPEIRKYIRRYNMYLFVLSLSWNADELEILENEDVPITGFVYPFESKTIKDLVGDVFDSNGNVLDAYDLEVVKASVKKVARDSLLPLTGSGKPRLTTRGSAGKSIVEYFKSEHSDLISHWADICKKNTISSANITTSSSKSNKSQDAGKLESKKSDKSASVPPKKAHKPKDFFEDFSVPMGSGQRLEALASEIVRIDYKKFPIAAGMLLRALLEETLNQHISRKSLDSAYKSAIGKGKPGLKSTVLFLADTKNSAFKDTKIALQLAKFQNSGVKDDLDNIVHSKWGVVTREVLLTVRPYVRPIIETIIYEEW
ncbi:hypothetical protein [Oceanicaulis alexandrii]|uniref:hypothetical protein n=1 Tax=Oceanicaulis alexandrii TaxID=153233 RepID=UPI003BB1EC3F